MDVLLYQSISSISCAVLFKINIFDVFETICLSIENGIVYGSTVVLKIKIARSNIRKKHQDKTDVICGTYLLSKNADDVTDVRLRH